MTPTLRWLSLSLSFLLFTACFEVREEISLSPNRSGSYAMVFEFTNPALAKLATEANGEPEGSDKPQTSVTHSGPPVGQMDQAKHQLEELNSQLTALQIEGINDGKVFSGDDGLSFGYSFSFDNLKALNKVIRVMRKEMNEKEEGAFRFPDLHFEKTAFTTTTSPQKMPAGQQGQDFLAAFGVEMPTYAVQFVVPKKIKSVAHPDAATLSVDQKTLTIRVPMDGKTSSDNTIRYR
jgi:hypothetical protein